MSNLPEECGQIIRLIQKSNSIHPIEFDFGWMEDTLNLLNLF